MKTISKVFSCILAFSSLLGSVEGQNRYKIWYDKPASYWEEALPIGNGRIAAMVFGDPQLEQIQLNEETVSAGSPYQNYNEEAKAALPEMRRLIFEGKYEEAQNMAATKILSQVGNEMPYQTVGRLNIRYQDHKKVSNYYRDLDISNAMTVTRYKVDGVEFTEETFASFTDQLVIRHIKSSKPGAINCELFFNTPMRDPKRSIYGKKGLRLEGITHGSRYFPGKVHYCADLDVKNKGGEVTMANDTLLSVQGASELTLYISMATNFVNYKDISGDPYQRNKTYLKNAEKEYDKAKAAHIAAYQEQFNRVTLDLGETSQVNKPMDVRIKEFSSSYDPALIALYFQYGRYLLIASSQPGCQPANLQGKWNHNPGPPWSCNYTTNINAEMNYWPAEITNLPECFLPLSDFIGRLAVNGAQTAKVNYGINRGWLAHHNSDVWAQTAPTGGYDSDPKGAPRWSCWPMAGVWLCQHLWEHYAFGGDKKYLSKTAYPLMKGAAEFLLQWLQKDPETGYWITNPSTSPENRFRYIDKEGKKQNGEISRSSGMDLGLAWDLLTNCIEASTVLDTDKAFRQQCMDVRANLQPFRIGSKGQLLEWDKEFEETDPNHRHVSHLFALHPGRQIIPEQQPELAAACQRTLEIRGDGGTGWAMAWKINFWARLRDGNHAFGILKNGLRYVDATQVSVRGGGTYANLFDAHPPFQIDGNFGGTAGITEMLLQSHAGYIHLLPALPDNWQSGSIKGVRARGGFTIDMEWKESRITRLSVTSHSGGTCRIREATSPHEEVIETEKGKTYQVK